MNKLLLLILFSFFTQIAYAKSPIRVAILDTGLDLKDPRFKNVLCKSGHIDFTGTGLTDNNGHGTFIAGLIKQYAKKSNYCLVIIKYSDPSIKTGHLQSSLHWSAYVKASIVNISGGGEFPLQDEESFIKNSSQKFILAAGNEGVDLDSPTGNYYPAKYHTKNSIIVSSLDKNGYRSSYSNYCSHSNWEIGENVISTLPNGKYGRMSGTSMSTAVKTGKYVYEITH